MIKFNFLIKKLLLVFFLSVFIFFWCSFGADDSWTLIPKTEQDIASQSKEVWSRAWKVWENYNTLSQNTDVWASFSTWIFSWDTIFYFLKHIAKVLSEIWLVVWAAMIIYAWYKYASGVFTWDASKWWKDAIKWAIYWLLIVIFSYAIMKILLSMFL